MFPKNNMIDNMNIMNMNNFQPIMPNQLNNDSNKNELMINLINQNNQMTNQIAFNNNMLKSMLCLDTNSKENKIESLLSILSDINFFPRYNGKKINVFFEDNTGIKINIRAPNDAEMKDLLVVFHIKLQLYGLENKIKIYNLEEYTFLFNSKKISLNEKTSIYDYGLVREINKIVFFLANNIIGG